MATSPFLPLPTGLEIAGTCASASTLTVSVVSTVPSGPCPLCHTEATRIHSRYQRTLADLPCGGQRVMLLLIVRRFVCEVSTCPRRIFTERLPSLVRPWARMTERLCQALAFLGLATGGEVAARLAPKLGMQVSPTTQLRLIMAVPTPPAGEVERAGIDDLAFRRRRTYGTILVNLQTHRVVDLLPDRSAATAKAWFVDHAEVRLVARDRGTDYAAAALQGAPQALQVADRFHLVKNLVEAVVPVLARCRPEMSDPTQAPAPSETEEQPTELVTPAEQVRQAHRAERYVRYQQVVRLREQGLTFKEIARQVCLGERTVRGWVAEGRYPETRYPRTHQSGFDAYAAYVRQRWEAGCHTGSQLLQEIRAQGYGGTSSTFYRYLAPLRPKQRAARAGAIVAPFLERFSAKQAVWLLVRDPANLEEREQEDLTTLCQESATIETTYRLVPAFLQMVRHLQGECLDAWLEQVRASQIPELVSFVGGIERDKKAVIAGLTRPESNAITEGHVNQLKVMKRMMFGRAGFPLLRQRVLHAV
jgi:transposase